VTRRIWLIAAAALLAACGDDDDAASPTSRSSAPATTHTATVPVATTPTTTTMSPSTTVARPEISTSTTVPVPTTRSASCSSPPAFDPESPLQAQFVAYLVTCGFTDPEAACLFDHLDFDDPAVLAGDPDAMVPAFETCRIDVDRMAEIANESKIDGGA
jgi:hypothetical protein